jgi:hypothetical protein
MVCAEGSTVTARILDKSITRPFSMELEPEVEWPPPRTVKGILCERMRVMVAETSAGEVTRITAAWG